MYSPKNGKFYSAIILASCNSLIQMCFISIGYHQQPYKLEYLSYTAPWSILSYVGLMIGFMVSELYFSKWREIYSIKLLWVLFILSFVFMILSSLVCIWFIGSMIFAFSSALLLILILNYITPYIKINEKSYFLPLLLSINNLDHDCIVKYTYFLSELTKLIIFI